MSAPYLMRKEPSSLLTDDFLATYAPKRTSDLIPMCHVLCLTNAKVTFELHPESDSVKAFCSVKTDGRTGVEMEALTGVTTALLTIYDMCKAIDKRMVIEDVHLIEKHGGRSGDFYFEDETDR